jgi:hypothetical protein
MTSQPNGRSISVASVDSKRLGPPSSRADASGGASRAGHRFHVIAAASSSQSSPISTPRAPLGKSRLCCVSAEGVSGPALVMSSSGAPPPRDIQATTNGRPPCAADSTAGRTPTKSRSAEGPRGGDRIA